MTSKNTWLISLIYIQHSLSIHINSVTSAINLTQIYFTDSNDSNPFDFANLNPGFMTNYFDSTNKQYLWLGIFSYINDTHSTQFTQELDKYSVKVDIFTTEFAQYNNNNIDLPLAVTNSTIIHEDGMQLQDGLFLTYGCTSPVTKDIINCWDNKTFINNEQDNILIFTISIQCRIFYHETNQWSDVITINPTVNNTKIYLQSNFGINAICFNDSYFIAYGFQYHDYSFQDDDTIIIDINSALLDLNGVIVYENVTLISNISMCGPAIISTKGNDKFLKTIAEKYDAQNVSGSFSIEYTRYSSVINVTNITGAFGYYTFLSDEQFPIYIYANHEISTNNNTNIFHGTDIQINLNTVLDFNNKCCYITSYEHPIVDGWFFVDIYLLITDYEGNNIIDDLLIFANNSQIDFMPQIIDLPMISTDDVRYFIVTSSSTSEEDEYATTVVSSVYYLQYDEQDDKYNIFTAGYFDTVEKQHDDDWGFQTCIGYVMPQTNYLYFAWSEFYGYGNGQSLYGQTFTIN